MIDFYYNKNTIYTHNAFANKQVAFYGSDDKELYFEKNYKDPNMPDIYKDKNKQISYNFNSDGYRTIEINECNTRDFILVFGCSYSEGVGLFYEDIWCNKLSKDVGIKNLNLAKASSGPDYLFYNTYQWIKNDYPLPKIVIYQWPQHTRRFFGYTDKIGYYWRHYDFKTLDEKWYYNSYIRNSAEMIIKNTYYVEISNLFWKNLNVPVLNYTIGVDYTLQKEINVSIETLDLDLTYHDKARDLQHDGVKMHSAYYNIIKNDVLKVIN